MSTLTGAEHFGLGIFYLNGRNGEATVHKNPKVLRVFACRLSSFPLTGKADCQVRRLPKPLNL